MEGNALQDLVRNILGLFDSVIYGFINTVYNTFVNISSYTLINNEVMETFTQRIYILIGVFMLFKLTFSLITYFINPDSLSEQKSGFGNLIQRVVISLVLLVLTPTLFNLAFKAQTIILKENILANLVLGGEYSSISTEAREEMYANAGRKMAFTTLSAFFHPEDEDVLNMSNEELSEKYKDDQDALKYLKEYRKAVEESDIDALVGWYKLNTKEDKDGKYLFVYSVLLSPIAGIMILWVLVIFCIDIGVRSVKLAFLQLISPIPILSYIDVKKGEGVFKKWIGDCFSTYLEVFVKLIAIYFVIFIISLISIDNFYEYALDANNNIVTQKVENVDLFAKALIIIGLLIFANEVPKLIGDMFGIKSDGFSLNPMKRIGASPLAAGLVGGITGGVIGSATSALSNFQMHKKMGHGTLGALRSGAGGLFAGGMRGARTGMQQKTFGDMKSKALGISSVGANKIWGKRGTPTGLKGVAARTSSIAQSKLGMMQKADRLEAKSQALKKLNDGFSKFKSAAEKEVDKGTADRELKTHVKDKKNAWESLKNIDVDKLSSSKLESLYRQKAEAESYGHYGDYDDAIAAEKQAIFDAHNAKVSAAEAAYWKERKEATQAYYGWIANGGNLDDVDAHEGYNEMIKAYKDDPDLFTDEKGNKMVFEYEPTNNKVADGERISKFNDQVMRENSELQRSEEYAQAQDLRNYANSRTGKSNDKK